MDSSASTVRALSLARRDLMMALQLENNRSTVAEEAGMLSYFASRGSTVYMAALDARKAFDRVNRVKLFNLLSDNNVFSSVISVHSLSACLLYFMLAALVVNKPIHNNHIRDGTIYIF